MEHLWRRQNLDLQNFITLSIILHLLKLAAPQIVVINYTCLVLLITLERTTALHYIGNIFGLMASHDCPDSRSDFMTQITAKFHLLIIVYIHLREAVMMKMIVTCRWPAMPADAKACFDEGYSQVGRLCKVECFAR